MNKRKNIYASEFTKILNSRDAKIDLLELENKEIKIDIKALRKKLTKYRLDAVEQLRKDLPEIEETFKNWLRYDDRDLGEEIEEEGYYDIDE